MNQPKDVIAAVLDEIVKTRKDKTKGPFKSTHEALGVIREEYVEFESDVFSNCNQDACEEAIQLAASALNFVIDFKEPFELTTSCLECKFVAECFGPRDNGCRRFPEKDNRAGI